jgi:hypothetical protein
MKTVRLYPPLSQIKMTRSFTTLGKFSSLIIKNVQAKSRYQRARILTKRISAVKQKFAVDAVTFMFQNGKDARKVLMIGRLAQIKNKTRYASHLAERCRLDSL